ncbi:hypothetical protein ACWGK6_13720 [Streptomyces violaceusniger]
MPAGTMSVRWRRGAGHDSFVLTIRAPEGTSGRVAVPLLRGGPHHRRGRPDRLAQRPPVGGRGPRCPPGGRCGRLRGGERNPHLRLGRVGSAWTGRSSKT